MCKMVFGCSKCSHGVEYEAVVMRRDPVDQSDLVYWLNAAGADEACIVAENFEEIPLDLFHNGTKLLPCQNCVLHCPLPEDDSLG